MGKKSLRREKAKEKATSIIIGTEPEQVQGVPTHHSPVQKSGVKALYEDHYKKLLIIPILMLVLAFAQIGFQTATTGDFITKGVSLKGGITFTLTSISGDSVSVEEQLIQKFPKQDITVRVLTQSGEASGLIIETDLPNVRTNEETNAFRDSFAGEVESILDVEPGSYSVEVIGSSLGDNFFRQTILALFIAFLFMGIVVFLYFRTFAPSAAIILAAFSDIVVTIAIINLLGVKISTAGIAAFLMLIGYSVDTDILLSTRVLKDREGSVMDAIYSAMKPGIVMTSTTIVAVTMGLLFARSDVLAQIMLIVLIGLVVDLINTWIQNVGILRLYLERKGQRK